MRKDYKGIPILDIQGIRGQAEDPTVSIGQERGMAMTKKEKSIVWWHIKNDPYKATKELYYELLEYVDVSLSTVRKYKRIILKNLEEKGE